MNTVQLAGKLYAARDTMRNFYGDRYEAKVRPVAKQLSDLSKVWNCSIVQVINRLTAEAKHKGHDVSGIELGLMFAAYVEDSEGTFAEVETEVNG